jgi:hypothetical protein
MDNTKKNILLVATITSLLIMGTIIIPMQSYGSEEQQKNGDSESSIKSGTEVDKKSASQKLNQDNLCYRSDDDCQQANQGQQITGKDNDANGFNDQSLNVRQAATPTPPVTPPTEATLRICKTVDNNATTSFQPSDFTYTFTTSANPSTLQGANEGCSIVTVDPTTYKFTEFFPTSVTGPFAVALGSGSGCQFDGSLDTNPPRAHFKGTLSAGDIQTCSLTNTIG